MPTIKDPAFPDEEAPYSQILPSRLLPVLLREAVALAFDALRQCTYRRVRHYVTTWGGTVEDAQDVFWEAVVCLHEAVRNGTLRADHPGVLHQYIYVAAKRSWRRQLQMSRKISGAETEFSKMHFDGPAEVHENGQEERLKVLEGVMENLDPVSKKILGDFYFQKKPIKTIASELGCTPAYLRLKKSRCLAKIRTLIQIQLLNCQPSSHDRL